MSYFGHMPGSASPLWWACLVKALVRTQRDKSNCIPEKNSSGEKKCPISERQGATVLSEDVRNDTSQTVSPIYSVLTDS